MEEGSDIFSKENIRNSWLKFFEDLFRHVLQETEVMESTTGYDLTPVLKKSERFPCKSGLLPSPECEPDDDYEFALALAASLKHFSASTSGSASASGYASFSSEYATAGSTSESGSSSESGSISATEYASGSESGSTSAPGSASGFAIAPGCTSESTSAPGYALGSMSESEYASGSPSASEYTSGYVSASGYASEGIKSDFSDMFNCYDRNLGLSIHRVLTEVAATDIDKLYQSIKEKIQTKEEMKMFIKRLTDKFLNGSLQQEMYFLAIISRIFSLLYKTGETNPKIFIEAVADTIFETEMELKVISSINPHELILQILRDSNRWVREFRDLNCGDASYYFF